ncbi:AAA family ATPase [Candidatus Woesearchaeota archaeon]|nr:AAA family ATPase [Candidatus Woesearchaeota archaeon]
MLVNSIFLENIRSYSTQNIDFSKNSTLLKGDIGSGKSTILYALEFALFGILRGELSGESLLRHGAKNGRVMLDFNVGNDRIIIERTLKRSKDSVEQSAGSIVINGVKQEYTPVELKARIFDFLGYSKGNVTKSKNLIYRYTVYTPQEEMKKIIQESNEVRLNLLRNIFDLDKYKRIRENVSIFLKNLREQKKYCEGSLIDFEEKKKECEEIKKMLSQKTTELELASQKTKEVLEKLEAKNKELKALEESKQALNKTKQELSKIQALTNAKKEQNTKYDYQVQKLTELNQKPKEILPALNKEEKKQELLDLQRKKEVINKSIVEARTKQEHSKIIITKLETLSHCPLCMQDVPHEHKSSIIEKEKTDTQKYDAVINNNQALLQKLIEKEELVRKEIEIINQKEQEYARFKEQLKIFEERKKQIEEYKKYAETISQEIINLKNQEKILEQQIDLFNDLEEKHLKIKQEYELVSKENQAALINQTKIKEQLNNYQLQELKLTKELEEKTLFSEQLNKIIKQDNWFNTFFIPLTETIEKQVMGRVYHSFNHLFSEWFNVLINDEYLSARLDDSFSPIMQQNGYDTSIDFLSGGEKTACALAYRLALNNAINDTISTIKTKDLLILDEPTDGFSTEQLDKMRDVLAQVKAKQIIIVSHESKIESFVENVIKVTKNGSVSRVEV